MKTTIIEKDSLMGRPSASGIFRLAQCPGSWLAEMKFPPKEESEDALTGPYLHECMEYERALDDPEQAEVVEFCHEAERALVVDIFGDCATHLTIIREERMFATDEGGNVVFSGKPDRVYYSAQKDVALVLDYKFGRLPVGSAESNRQLAALAVLLRYKMGHCPSTVFAGIIEPYVSRRKPRLVQFRMEHLDAAEVFLRKVISDAETPNAPLRPDEEACRCCRAKTVCPAVQMALLKVTSMGLSAVWEQWTPEKRREIYDLAQLAKRWAVSVEAKVRDDLMAKVAIPGLCLSSGKGALTVTNAAAVCKVLNNLFQDGIEAEKFAGRSDTSIAEQDNLVHSAGKIKGGTE